MTREADGPRAGSRPYRMRARKAAVQHTRERILEAAAGLWLEQSYDEVTLDAVADRAGVTRQTVIRHFGSKDGLVVGVAAWAAPRETAERSAEPGDIDGAISVLVSRYEEMGDANVRMLQLEDRIDTIGVMLRRGRESHRAWLEEVFGPVLPRRGSRRREELVDALYAATDVTVWKLLRRDLGRSVEQTEALVRRLVGGLLTATNDEGDR